MTARTAGFLVALFGLAHAVPAQIVVIDTLRAVQPWGARTAYTFPSVRVLKDEVASERINRSLMADFLGVDPGTSDEDPLNALWGENSSGRMARISEFKWNCSRTTPAVLTIELSGEFCAAYCEGFLKHYLYDLRTGASLTAEEIFTPAGLEAVNDSLSRSWQRSISDQIQVLQDSLRVRNLTAATAEEMNNAIRMYRVCFESRPKDDPYIEDMVLLPEGLRFVIARCSAHVDRELDTLDPMTIDLPKDWLGNQLLPEVSAAFGW